MTYLYYVVRLYELVLIARIFMSWIHPDPSHPVVQWIYRLTEPALAPVRRVIPLSAMGIDFSPIVVFIALDLVKRAIMPTGFF